jgi:ornithine carbamoyltransferase
MGQEQEAQKRIEIFKPYQVTAELMKQANPEAIFMHDMPAYRGKEVADEVIDGPQSVIYQEAGNRLHTAAALLKKVTQS